MTLRLKRVRGFGNVLQLLPAIEALSKSGKCVELLTREEFIPVLRLADLDWSRVRLHPVGEEILCDVDLDDYTRNRVPSEHRVLEFCQRLGVSPYRGYVPISFTPEETEDQAPQYVISPEASHPARVWGNAALEELCQSVALRGNTCVVGTRKPTFRIPNVSDLCGTTTLLQLLSILSQSSVVISMDSGVMHLAASLQVPVVALFGSIDPRLRMTYYDSVCAIAPLPLGKMPNKAGGAESTTPINRINSRHVLRAISCVQSMREQKGPRIFFVDKLSRLRDAQRTFQGA